MPLATLSAAFVAAAQCPPGQKKIDFYSDSSQVTGFVLECRCTGGKTYYLRYQDQAGRQRQIKIARVEDVTFAAALKKAQQLRSEVVMGGDPGAAKAVKRATPLYKDLADMHLEHARQNLKSFLDVEAIMRLHLLPKLGRMPVNEIDSRVVGQLLASKRASGLAPATVEKIRVTLGRSFELGTRWSVPGTSRNPTKGLGKPVQNAREFFLTPEQAERLRHAASTSDNPQLQHIVGLLLLTGARKRELLDAKWEHIDLDRQTWLIPTTKNGKPRYVPLSNAAVSIIRRLPRFRDCIWLIPNVITKKPFVTLKTGWARAIKQAMLPGLRVHDLRHSAASFMISNGVPIYTIGKVLGHSNVSSTARYSHVGNEDLLRAVESGAAKQMI
ncbi:tyrosine-type recombinase/integrase [Brevundimonas sp. R86498]|uniref:tyrosine-type recombinase/integrase n=1 Tax=Brevundimonas sp. R86498 TaxID=3093845 RepID=UPI0037CACA32